MTSAGWATCRSGHSARATRWVSTLSLYMTVLCQVLTRDIPPNERPNCQPCGECFDNWDLILEKLQENTTK